ncbi:MAG TPA: Stp1/IreP family PP2C-type Ser/Thr phosphatase [Bacilli bacterium]|jgi:protein phosphatase|nr:Stp1/IreP family PP2C-type Ser/Thr phosphatase [Bacilli bacterium]HPZ23243.1 Stp1/IreP family PP2C-type Ser/Thr phosphatase [Bacilli bacterium]HQC83499.1 Stp1/IreP family PP2C-type Ser/Thr phosphatase [Bacilli bacterium]
MKSFYITDAGRVRSHNEDSVTIVKNASSEHLMIVADGMGGHRAGEVASSMVVSQIGSRFQKLSTIGSKQDAVNWLRENVKEVNSNILKYSNEHPEAAGLGTTCVMALLTKDFLMFVNIGDSSGFVFKDGKLKKITKDHTLVNFLVESGDLSPDEAINHPKKNVLMKALGASDQCELDIFDVDTNIDAIMLSSDGLTNMLSFEQIERVLNETDINIENKLIKLVKKCNVRGGLDNISIALLIKNGKGGDLA